ncbi:hypothetical protein O7A70_31645 [Mesorhizobium sp. Cs1299R1N1]|uniref:hypothetical protein n=1 Tax=Mesorhizobium sp. Cs1299R1N1 TaxID=3015172 RepID=UPI00301BFCC6
MPGFPGREAALLEIPAFDEHDASAAMPETKKAVAADTAGSQLFQTDFTPQTGLGLLFNATSCVA